MSRDLHAGGSTRGRTALWLATGVFCLVILMAGALAPVTTGGGDSFGHLLVAQSLLRDGDIRLDEYRDYFTRPTGEMHHAWHEHGGHAYHLFPLGVPLLSLPAVAAANLAGLDVRQIDLLLQKLLAALSTVAIFLVTLVFARRHLPPWTALAVSGAGLFGTLVGATALTGLWNLNYEVLLAGLALLLLQGEGRPRRGWLRPALLGLVLFLGYLNRPTFAVLIVIVFPCLWLSDRRVLAWAAGVSAALLALFMVFSLGEFGQFLPPYYLASRLDPAVFPTALRAALFSASRNVLVWTPLLLVFPLLLWRNARALLRPPALALLGAACGCAVPMLFFPHWTLGHSYGPRGFMTSAYLVLCLAIVLAGEAVRDRRRLPRPQLAALAVGLGLGLLVNLPGLFNPYVLYWNRFPDIDEFPEQVVFDWRYPQFLADRPMLQDKYRTQARELGLAGATTFIPVFGSGLWLGGLNGPQSVLDTFTAAACAEFAAEPDELFLTAFVLPAGVKDLTLEVNGAPLPAANQAGLLRNFSGRFPPCREASDNALVLDAAGGIGSAALVYYLLTAAAPPELGAVNGGGE